jgi:hypothetical protein
LVKEREPKTKELKVLGMITKWSFFLIYWQVAAFANKHVCFSIFAIDGYPCLVSDGVVLSHLPIGV